MDGGRSVVVASQNFQVASVFYSSTTAYTLWPHTHPKNPRPQIGGEISSLRTPPNLSSDYTVDATQPAVQVACLVRRHTHTGCNSAARTRDSRPKFDAVSGGRFHGRICDDVLQSAAAGAVAPSDWQGSASRGHNSSPLLGSKPTTAAQRSRGFDARPRWQHQHTNCDSYGLGPGNGAGVCSHGRRTGGCGSL